jgi:hypothetical protein
MTQSGGVVLGPENSNDAWQVALADHMGAILVGNDPRVFRRLGDRYEDHRAG